MSKAERSKPSVVIHGAEQGELLSPGREGDLRGWRGSGERNGAGKGLDHQEGLKEMEKRRLRGFWLCTTPENLNF